MGRKGYIENLTESLEWDGVSQRQVEEMLDRAFDEGEDCFVGAIVPEKRSVRWLRITGSLAFITLIVLFCNSLWNSTLARHGFDFYDGFIELSIDDDFSRKVVSLDTEAELLCYGDPEALPENRMKALWEGDPERGAYYLEHLNTYRREKGELPNDWQEQSEKVFPRNGVAHLMQASMLSEGVLKKNLSKEGLGRLSASVLTEGDAWRDYVVSFEVTDEEKYNQWLEAMDKAMSYPELEFYATEVMYERYLAFCEPTSFMEFTARLGLTFSWVSDFALLQKRNADLLAYRVGELAKAGDVDGVRRIEQQWLRLLDVNSQSVLLIDGLVSAAITGYALNFAEAEMILGEEDRSRAFLGLAIWNQQRSDLTKENRGEFEFVDASFLESISIPSISRFAPEIKTSDEELEPGRMVERAVAGQLSHWIVIALLLLVSFVLFLSWVFGATLRKGISSRMLGAFRCNDYLWVVFAGGFVAPLVYYFANDPGGVGLASIGYKRSEGWQPLVQFLSLLVLALGVPVFVCWWRIKLRFPMLLSGSWKYGSYLIFGAMIAPFVLWGLRGTNPVLLSTTALALCVVPLLWLLWRFLRAAFGDKRYGIKNQMMSHMLIFSYAIGGCVLLACSWMERGREAKWAAQWDTFNLVAEGDRKLGFESRVGLFLNQQLEGKLDELKANLD